MLKKWIDEIREKTDLYKTDSWKYHISGNVIELSILPVYLKDKSSYRCSVITVGQVLKALSCYIEQQQYNFHIQSFPSLENPEIVASIRMDGDNTFLQCSDETNKRSLNQIKPQKIVQTLARQYQLDITKIENPAELQFEGINVADFNSWFVLYSTFNNPFTWLNIGYWKESIQNDCHDQFSIQEFKIIDFCDDACEDQSDMKIPKNKYAQSLIGINQEITTG